jgi:hypothetical protein
MNCPKCDAAMTIRTNRTNGNKFYGCTRYNQGCRGTRNVPVAAAVVEAAAAARKVMIGTDEQDAFWHEVATGTGHICNSARAGSGKSTSSVEGMWKVSPNLTQGYYAFNTDIVTAFRPKAPPHVAGNVQTFNAAGRAILLSAFPGSVLAKEKTLNLLSQIYTPRSATEVDTNGQLETAVRKLVELARGCMMTDLSADSLREIAFEYNVELTSEIESKVLEFVPVLIEMHKAQTASHDFADQLWLPVILNLPCRGLDMVWIDEAQDLNAVKMLLALKLLAPTGRCIFVGDPFQAINGFTGADVRSMETFTRMLEEKTGKPVVKMGLTYTFRCGTAHVADVLKYVPDIRTPEMTLSGQPWHTGEIIDTTIDAVKWEVGQMGICRCNAPLTGVAYRLIKAGIPAKIKGRDIGAGLISLIKRLRAKSVNDLALKLDKWVARELEKISGTRNAEGKAEAIQDRADCIRALSEDIDGIPELIGRIDNLFSLADTDGNPKGFVILSSIHKAKGLEADTVVWIQPDITCKTTNEDQAQQERNLKYVAGTRPRKVLIKAYKPAV